MIESKAEYYKKLEELKQEIISQIEKKGIATIDKLSIGWEELVDLSVDYEFKYPLDIEKVIVMKLKK